MVKRMRYEYRIIQCEKHQDVAQSMLMVAIHWNEENHVDTAPAPRQFQPIQRATVRVR